SRANGDDQATAALSRGKGDALSLAELPHYCEVLYAEAALREMVFPLTPTKKVLAEYKLLTAVENNDCNWDDATQAETSKYPAINERSRSIAGDKSTMMSWIYRGSEALAAVEDEALSYGLDSGDPATLKKRCKEIAAFASKLKW